MQVRSPAVDDTLHIIGLHHLGVVRQRLDGAFAHDLCDYFAAVAIYAEHDVNTVANTARIMIQDVSDVFTVMERRGFDLPAVG